MGRLIVIGSTITHINLIYQKVIKYMMYKVKLKMKIPTYAILLFLVLLSTITVAVPVKAQEIPRAEAVIWATGAPPPVLNPLATASHSWRPHVMYPSLFFQDQLKDRWIPYLVESWRWVEPYVFEVKLRPEARWSDGKPVTAYDVVFSFELGKKYNIYAYHLAWLALERVDAVDERTVRFVSSSKKFNFFNFFGGIGSLSSPILPKHRWEELEKEWGAGLLTEFKDLSIEEHITGGPYKAFRVTEDSIIYIRDDNWWGKNIFGLPKPKYLVLKYYVDATPALLVGEVDIAGTGIPEVWKLWEEQRLKIRTYYREPPYHPHLTMYLLFFNWEKEYLRDPELKKALAYAIPYDDIVTKVYANYAIRPACLIPVVHDFEPAHLYMDWTLCEKTRLEYNPVKAQELLDKAGYVKGPDGWRVRPDGQKLSFSIITPNWPFWVSAGELIVSSFRAIGVDAKLEIMEFVPYWDRVYYKTADYEAALCWDAGLNYDYPWIAFRYLMDPRTENFGRLDPEDPRMKEVVTLIDAIPAETDPAKVKEYFKRLQELWLEMVPAIPLYYPPFAVEYNEQYWVGWPSEEYHSWWWSSYGHFLPVLFAVAPSGETPSTPDWITRLSFTSTKFLEELKKSFEAKPTEVITTIVMTTPTTAPAQTVTVTITTPSVSTITSIATTTAIKEVPVTDITSIVVAGIVLFIIGLAIGGLIFRRRPK